MRRPAQASAAPPPGSRRQHRTHPEQHQQPGGHTEHGFARWARIVCTNGVNRRSRSARGQRRAQLRGPRAWVDHRRSTAPTVRVARASNASGARWPATARDQQRRCRRPQTALPMDAERRSPGDRQPLAPASPRVRRRPSCRRQSADHRRRQMSQRAMPAAATRPGRRPAATIVGMASWGTIARARQTTRRKAVEARFKQNPSRGRDCLTYQVLGVRRRHQPPADVNPADGWMPAPIAFRVPWCGALGPPSARQQ